MANVRGETIGLNELPDGCQVVTFGHRSGAETHERCPRAYYYNYEYLGPGISTSPTPIYFAVGSAVHLGLAALLLDEGIDAAVQQGVDYLKNGRVYEMLSPEQQIEQEVLVHGLIYAFYVWAWPGLSKNFEVLTVETGAVEYIPLDAGNYIAMQSRPDAILRHRQTHEVAGLSWKTIDDLSDMRRSQFHNDLQGYMELYYGEKTLEVLAQREPSSDELRAALRELLSHVDDLSLNILADSLTGLAARAGEMAKAKRNIPRNIDYIQTVFLVKGKRKLLADVDVPWMNEAGASNDEDEYDGYDPTKQYKQMSHLCYRYRNSNTEVIASSIELYKSGPNKGKPKPIDLHDPNFVDESWAYRFFKPSNSTMSGLSSKWLTSPIQPDQVRGWIDRLAAGSVYPTSMNDERNKHPLDKIIKFEEPMYKEEHRVVSHVNQQRNRYVQIAEAVRFMNNTISVSDLSYGVADTAIKYDLDALFPQHLINCRTPYRCAYHDFCHTPRESEIDFASVPKGFEVRQPHHEAERQYKGGADGKNEVES